MEEKKLKQLIQAWHSHHTFQPLPCLFISFACKIVFYCSHIFVIFDFILIISGQAHQIVIYHISSAVSQFVVSYQSLSLSRLLQLLILLLLLGHYCLLFCSIRSLCPNLEDIALSLIEKWGTHQDLNADFLDLPYLIILLYHRIVTYQCVTITTYGFQLLAIITLSFKKARVPAPKPRSPNCLTSYKPKSPNHSTSYNLHCIIDKLWWANLPIRPENAINGTLTHFQLFLTLQKWFW